MLQSQSTWVSSSRSILPRYAKHFTPSCDTSKSCWALFCAKHWAMMCPLLRTGDSPSSPTSHHMRQDVLRPSHHHNTLSKAWCDALSWHGSSTLYFLNLPVWRKPGLHSMFMSLSPLAEIFSRSHKRLPMAEKPWDKFEKMFRLAVQKDSCNTGACFNLLFGDSQWFSSLPSPVSARNVSFMHWKLRSAVLPGLQEVELQEQQ